MKVKFFFGANTAAKFALAGLTLALVGSACAQPVCKALTSVGSSLYQVAADGTVLNAFPYDGVTKLSISLSPEGSKVAYLSAGNPNAFTIVNTDGRAVTIPVVPNTLGPLVRVSWNSESIIKLQYHASRDNNLFEFYSVPEKFTYPLSAVTSPVMGTNCAAQIGDNHTSACLSENKLIVNKKIIADFDPLLPANVVQIAQATVPINTLLSTQTIPSFQMKVISIQDGVTLRIFMPDGTWSEARTPVGQPFPINWEDKMYGFIPSSVDSAKGLVTISVVKSKSDNGGISPALTWSSSNYITTVVQGPVGKRLLHVKSSGQEAPMFADLNIDGTVTDVVYDTPTLLMLKTSNQFVSIPINYSNGGAASLKLGAATSLPLTLDVKLPGGIVKANVVDWSCR
jgi:hypothetical protein